MRYAKKSYIEKEGYLESFNLVFSEIIKNLLYLSEEFLTKENYFEGDWIGDGGLVYKARLTIIFGVLTALEIFLLKKGEKGNILNDFLQ